MTVARAPESTHRHLRCGHDCCIELVESIPHALAMGDTRRRKPRDVDGNAKPAEGADTTCEQEAAEAAASQSTGQILRPILVRNTATMIGELE